MMVHSPGIKPKCRLERALPIELQDHKTNVILDGPASKMEQLPMKSWMLCAKKKCAVDDNGSFCFCSSYGNDN